MCKAYKTWTNVMDRPQVKKGYEDVTVDARWHSFEDFKVWFNAHAVPGYDLDKDFVVEGNRHYGPDTCVFIPRWLNSAVKRRPAGKNLPGVSENGNRFSAMIANTYLGLYASALEAHQAWQKAKIKSLQDYQDRYQAETSIDPRVYARLQSLIEVVRMDLKFGRPTSVFSKIAPKN